MRTAVIFFKISYIEVKILSVPKLNLVGTQLLGGNERHMKT